MSGREANIQAAMDDTIILDKNRGLSECHSNEYAGLQSRAFTLDQFLPGRQADMQPILHANRKLACERAAYAQSMINDWNLNEKRCPQESTPVSRVWASPSLYNLAEYDDYNNLSYHHPGYTGAGVFHNGGRTNVFETSNSGSQFPPILNERVSVFGHHSHDTYSLASLSNIYSRSPASLAGMRTPTGSSHRDLLSECGVDVEKLRPQEKQITLHEWFLIRAPSVITSTTNNTKKAGISLGGFVRFGSQDSQLVETSAIAERLEKCKLRTFDGTKIFLEGCIDQQNTIANGFSISVAHSFLTGFPFNWRYLLLETSVMTPSDGAKTIASSHFEEAHSFHQHVDGGAARIVGTNDLRLSQSRNVVPVSPLILFPEITCGNQERPVPQHEVGDVVPKSCAREAQGANHDHLDNKKFKMKEYMSSSLANGEEPQSPCGVSGAAQPRQFSNNFIKSTGQFTDGEVEDYRPASHDAVPNDPTTQRILGNADNVTHLYSLASPLTNGVDTVDGSRDRNHTIDTISIGASLDGKNTLTGVECNSDIDTEQVVYPDTASELAVKTNNHLITGLENHVADVPNIQDNSDLSHAELRSRENGASQVLCHHRPMRKFSKRLRKENTGSKEGTELVEQIHDIGQADLKRAKNSVKASRKFRKPVEEEPCRLDGQKSQEACVDEASKIGLQKVATRRIMTRKASAKRALIQASEFLVPPQDCGHNEEHVDSAATVKENERSSGSEEAQVPSPDVECLHLPKIMKSQIYDDNLSKQKQAESKSTMKTRQKKSLILPPPLPSPRVNVSKDQVIQAYGLKMSRSGRLLVPPLAYWRNQSLAHDMDGGIIAIREGFEEPPSDTGCYNFKPPTMKTAVKLQEELCAAAADLVIHKRSKKNKKKL
ncbi:hypothetical protein O6H91_07G056800 [Diphasiastrum complanatum]|uniref:Uncharacterized protein n=2 Tax=Diphasiastrum complanatum TaxID=34168 RepID=A0ACC2D5X2_DIPCM|nr:hypothetical protein O6H91_07G056800 [Diphasiastrum complanatum]